MLFARGGHSTFGYASLVLENRAEPFFRCDYSTALFRDVNPAGAYGYTRRIAEPSRPTNDEIAQDDVIIRYEGDEIVGFTILHASKR